VVEIENPRKGRRGAGTVNHCVHGPDTLVEEILDWRPHDYFTCRYQLPMPGVPKMNLTHAFTALPEGGTRIESRIAPAFAKDRDAVAQMLPGVEPMVQHNADRLVELLAKAAAGQAAADDEPPLPAAMGRFASG
jgi:hypothetical protein